MSYHLTRTDKCNVPRCPGNLYYQKCTNTTCRVDNHISGWGVLRHMGVHGHPWPRKAKADRLSKSKLAEKIKSNPSAGPLQLTVSSKTALIVLFHVSEVAFVDAC